MSRATTGRRLTCAALLAGAALLSGCATITYDTGTIERAVAMNRVAATNAYEVVGSLDETTRAVFVIADLITVVDSKLADILRRELTRTGGDAVINLRIHEEYDILDAVIAVAQSALLFGGRAVGTRTITYEGDIVRWTGSDIDAALLEDCTAVEIATAEGGTRTAHLCAADRALAPR